MAKIKMTAVYCDPNTHPTSKIYIDTELDTGFEKRYPYRFELDRSGSSAIFSFDEKPTLTMTLPHISHKVGLPKNAYISHFVLGNLKKLPMSFNS